ncbi:MAG: retroviral-like aspartic protease family protein [Ardenticatenaceae bacterium]|nr:retroviral-like aspartic protease family protein [Ardenticatenaceae bacterium]
MSTYDTTYDPPAPVLDVTVTSVVNRRRRRSLRALLDTGSDITAIPHSLMERLQLYPIGRLQLEDVEATTRMVLTYAVQLTIGDLSIPRLEVILTGLDFAVIGRDVLNRLYLLLNGPELDFHLETTPFLSPKDPNVD